MSEQTHPALAFHNVSKVYAQDGATRAALVDVSFTIPRGATVAIVGRSGSGKSTLLHVAAGIDAPSSGEVRLDGTDLARLSDSQRTVLRRRHVGLVFQFFHLLPHLTVAENVALPGLIAGGGAGGDRVHDLLHRVGLADRAGDHVQQLSGGEMQRVAICRAVLQRPALLLADEPTGNLDDDSSRVVMELMLRLAADEGSTLILVTHSAELAALAQATWRLTSGRLSTS